MPLPSIAGVCSSCRHSRIPTLVSLPLSPALRPQPAIRQKAGPHKLCAYLWQFALPTHCAHPEPLGLIITWKRQSRL